MSGARYGFGAHGLNILAQDELASDILLFIEVATVDYKRLLIAVALGLVASGMSGQQPNGRGSSRRRRLRRAVRPMRRRAAGATLSR
jgi:hypothetical protein